MAASPSPSSDKVIAVTGHRPDKLLGYGRDREHRLGFYARMCLNGVSCKKVITGMALGWDMAVAGACVFWHIPFMAVIPFDGQELRWPEESQYTYRQLLRIADETTVVSGGKYSAYKMQLRNQFMVDRCDLLLALWDGSDGGTANCVRYAQEIGKPVHNCWDNFKKTFRL